MILLFIIIGALIGLFCGLISKGEGEASYTLREVWHASVGAAIPGAIIGAVIGILLSIFAIFDMGVSGLLATLILGLSGALIMALIFGVFTALVKGLANLVGEKGARVITSVIVGAVIGTLIGLFFSPGGAMVPLMSEYLKFADPLKETIVKGIGELTKFRYCFYADPRCPFFVSWEDPNIQQSKEELYIKIDFSEKKILHDNSINLLVSLSVSNPELAELHVKPRCYFKKEKERELRVGKLGTYSFGDEFVFPSTAPGQELHTTFRCVGEIPEAIDKNIYSEYIVIELERPVNVKTTWPLWIGQQPRMGIVKSEMKFNAPYIVSLGSNNDMPFSEGEEYDFQLTIKKKGEDTILKKINIIDVQFPEDILANCEHFEGIDHEFELRDYDYENLKSLTQYDKESDKFVFPCSLYVISAPREAVLAPIELEAHYIVYSDYKTRITKSP